ncbi:hypothetical protein ABZ299_06440 [Streptomyces sp. NPDC006184]|uniref:hypothetical protein n=1 Tax=unclassified Streptomyces TaxID=2593676 RepID=UPI0033BD0830
MTVTGGLPYEECARWGRRSPRDAVGPWPAYALPPFRPAPRPPVHRPPVTRPRPRRRVSDQSAVSSVLTALCAAALLVTVVLATVRTRG